MPDVLERGAIAFFYRPRVERHAPRSEDDVQRFLVVLAPEGRSVFRLVQVGRKHLPASGPRRERNWAFVAKVAADVADLELELRGFRYSTKTRGERDQPAARPAGEGRYAIVRHGEHAHLAYRLTLPAEPGPVQDELGIEARASYVVAVWNPEDRIPSPQAGLDEERTAFFPDELQARFRGRRFAPLEPGFLDREGAELVLVGARGDPEAELGLRLEPEGDEDREVIGALDLDPVEHPLRPLFSGEWA
jgi:hypothetical protein